MRLADVAPRLALARDQHNAMMAERIRVRDHARGMLLHKQWLVAHRELQLVRAMATGSGTYIASRQRKLAQARRELADTQARAA